MILLQAILTALLSGIFSGGIIFALNERKERRAFLLSKAEEAVVAYGEWIESLNDYPTMHFDLFAQDRPAARQRLLDYSARMNVQRMKARHLIKVYLPSKYHAISQLINAYKDFNEKSRDIKLAALKGEGPPDWMSEAVSKTQSATIAESYARLDELYQAATDLAHAPFLVSKTALLSTFGRRSS